ncbi:MAG TPA: glycosyltransferase family 39 protein [bacterium]|nr:glycosyltransferase family 39 protein [bacterium]
MSGLRKNRRTQLFFMILAGAFIARFLLIARLDQRVAYSDEQKNLLLAANLTGGAGYVLADGKPTAVIPAGYPLWLAALRMAGMTGPAQVRLAQLVISLATIVFVAFFSRMLFGSSAALLAAAGCALYPYFIFLPGTILATTLYSMLLVLGAWMYMEAVNTNNNKMMFFGGMVWGWAVLTVTTAIVLAGATVVWHLRHASGSRGEKLRLAGCFLAGMLLLLAPWMVRNQHKLGRPLLATNGGYNLWLGNNPAADIEAPCGVPTPPAMDERIIRSGSELYADSLFSATARAYIAAEPGAFAKRTLLKGLFFWRLDPSPVTASYLSRGELVRILGLITFLPLLILTFWGYIKAPPQLKKRMALFFYYALAYTAVHAVMIIKVRLRLPLDHFIIMMAAYGLTLVRPPRPEPEERMPGSA